MTGRIVEEVKGKKYKVIIEAGKDPSTGKRKRIVRRIIGRRPEAEKVCADIIRELEQGIYIEPSKITIAEYMEHWLKTYAVNKAPSTFAGYQRIVRSHIIPQLGHIQLSRLQPMHIQEYYTNRLQEGHRSGKGGLSAKTVRQHHAVLREALYHAVKWQMLIRNPADLTEPPSPEIAEIFPLEPEELDKLLEAAKGHRDECLYIVAAYTGMREGELLALTWPNVDVEGKCCYVRQTVGYINKRGFVFRPTAKHRKARREIPLPDIAVEALKKQKKLVSAEKLRSGERYHNLNLTFPNGIGKPLDPSDMTGRFKKLAVEAGFPNVRFHDLRHTHATMLLKQGVHPKIVQERLGQQTIGITLDIYSHVIPSMQQEAVDKLNEFLNSKWHQNGTKTEKDRH